MKVVLKRALSLVLLGFFAFSPMLVSAAGCKQESSYQQCDIDSITVNMDTYAGGSSPDNYARVGADGTLRMTAKVTLATPSYFTVGTDKVNTNTWGSNTVSSFAIGLIPKSQTSTKCHKDSTVSIGAATTFINCEFAFTSNGQTSGRVDSGGVLVSNGFSISGSQFAQLGMTAPATGYTRYSLLIYPYMNYGAVSDTQIAFDKAGKEMVIDLYAKQTDATAANASGRPTDIPGYGSTSGGASNGEEGGPLWGIINKIVGFLLGIIQEIIYAIFYFLIVPIIQAMLSIRVYTDTFVSVIYPGWIVLRNLCNIIFIVAIMAIAMGTLLRVDAYKSRSVLVQLILAALLVNFSLVIAQIVLGVADTVQNQFLPNNQEVIRALGKDLMVAYRSEVYNLKLGGYFSDIVKQFMFLILATGSFMVFLAIAAFLFIRMIMLWILLMLSPLAYAAGALPSTAHYRKEWWTTFLKYAFFTPIMAFFLNMTAIISNTYKKNPIFGDLGVKDSDFGDSSLAGFVFRVGSTLLLIVFLLVALKVAESFSIYGASEVSKFAKKGMFAPAGLAAKSAGGITSAAGRWYTKKATLNARNAEQQGKTKTAALWRGAMLLNPKVAKKAWEERSHDKEMEAYSEAYGASRDTLNRIMPTEYQWKKIFKGDFKQGLGQKTYYGRIGHANMIAHKRSEWEKANLSAQEKAQALKGAHHADEVEALGYIIADGRHEDDFTLLDTPELRAKVEKMKGTMAQQKLLQLKELRTNGDAEYVNKSDAELETEAKEFGDKEAQGYFDKVEWADTLYHKLTHGGATHEDAIERIRHLQEYYEGEQKSRGIGMVVEDTDGQHRLASDLSVYGTMNNKELLNNLYKLGIFKVNEDDVDKETGNLKDHVTSISFEMLDRRTGKSLGTKTISNYQDFQNAVEDTKAKYNNFYDHAWKKADLGYAVAGARGWKLDARTRHRRGKGEGWAMDFEPAQNKIQTQREGYIGLNSFGERAEAEKPDTHLSSMAKSRNAQSRGPEDAGITVREDGRHDFKWNDLALNMRTNIKLTQTLVEQAKLTTEELDTIVTTINRNEDLRRVVNLRDDSGNLRDVKFEDLVAPSRPGHKAPSTPAAPPGGTPPAPTPAPSLLVDQFGRPVGGP